jgi:hypothetical protein
MFLFSIANYCVPNIPANGPWHEWTFNYEVQVDNNEVHLDIAEREAKILVYRGDNWKPEPVAESPPSPKPVAESPPAVQSNTTSQEQQKQPDSSTNQKPESTPSDAPSQ